MTHLKKCCAMPRASRRGILASYHTLVHLRRERLCFEIMPKNGKTLHIAGWACPVSYSYT